MVTSLLLTLLTGGLGLAGTAAATAVTYTQKDGDRAAYTASVTNVIKFTMQGQTVKLSGGADIKILARFMGLTPKNTIQVEANVVSGSEFATIEGKHATKGVTPRLASYEVTPRGELRLADDEEGGDEGLLVAIGPGDAFLGMGAAVLPTKPLKVGDRWEGTVSSDVTHVENAVPIKYSAKALGQVSWAGELLEDQDELPRDEGRDGRDAERRASADQGGSLRRDHVGF